MNAKVNRTPEQSAFINELVNGTGHIALVARAGTGKTTTILMGVDELVKKFPRADIAVCAYNAAIAKEVGEKLTERGHQTQWVDGEGGRRIPPRVTAATLHSLGYGLVRTAFKSEVDGDKVKKIIERLVNSGDNDLPGGSYVYREWGALIAQLVGYAKNAAVGFFPDLPISSSHTWFNLADHYDVNGVDDMLQMEQIVEAAKHVYVESLKDVKTVDFDDMILFPLIKNLAVKWGKDFIFLDEAQDLSRARQALAKKFVKFRTGRMIIVGDDRQAIYGFSGADAAALHNLIRELNCTVLPLTVTWRCPQSVVKLAQTLVPDIKCATDRVGVVTQIDATTFAELELTRSDAILCRNTAPLISAAYKLIRRGIPCKVEGRAIGDGLDKMVSRWKVKTIDALLNRLEVYRIREVQKAQAKGNEQKVEEVNDKCETLKEICNAVLSQGKSTVQDVRDFISNLFADGQSNVLTLATYHRSKGREWDRVFLWEHAQRCPSRGARQEWQKLQEANLAYVAYTRAKSNLVFVG